MEQSGRLHSESPHVAEVGSRASVYPTILRDFSAPPSAVTADELNMAVKKTGNSKAAGRNKPPRNSKLPALAMLCFMFLLLLTSCGEEQPTRPQDTAIPEIPSQTAPPTPMTPTNPSPTSVPTATMEPVPAATEVATHAATKASDDERESDDKTKVAVQQLFDTWNRALKEDDAALFHSILTRELAESCGLDELQSWLEQNEEFFAETVVTAVFLDVADPTRAFAELTAGQPEEAISFPWPVELEDGEWRSGILAGFTADRCPYVAESLPSGPEGREREIPEIPGLDLDRREEIFAAVPGTRVVRGSFRTGNSGSRFSSGGSMSPYDNQVNIYGELETELAAAELVSPYRDGLNHPSWEIIDEGSSGDFGWFSWTVHDTEGRLWRGRLVVVPLHEGWKQVWLSLYSNDADESQ